MLANVAINSATPLQGGNYLTELLSRIENATSRVWAAVFLVELRLESDASEEVRLVMNALRRAAWRNVDVKLLIGYSRIFDIELSANVTLHYAQSIGIDCRILGKPGTPGATKQLHSKYVLIDNDISIIGGHNWSTVGFQESNQASISLRSEALTDWLAGSFQEHWELTE
ncbi:MAG: hypothetical protein Tsb002_01000 [Wenzhouxiangellaceae bacterium]